MIGGIAGGIIAGYIMQAIGRKYTSMISSIPYFIGLAVSKLVILQSNCFYLLSSSFKQTLKTSFCLKKVSLNLLNVFPGFD